MNNFRLIFLTDTDSDAAINNNHTYIKSNKLCMKLLTIVVELTLYNRVQWCVMLYIYVLPNCNIIIQFLFCYLIIHMLPFKKCGVSFFSIYIKTFILQRSIQLIKSDRSLLFQIMQFFSIILISEKGFIIFTIILSCKICDTEDWIEKTEKKIITEISYILTYKTVILNVMIFNKSNCFTVYLIKYI